MLLYYSAAENTNEKEDSDKTLQYCVYEGKPKPIRNLMEQIKFECLKEDNPICKSNTADNQDKITTSTSTIKNNRILRNTELLKEKKVNNKIQAAIKKEQGKADAQLKELNEKWQAKLEHEKKKWVLTSSQMLQF